MLIRGFNRIDRHLTLSPRDYIVPGHAFGIEREVTVVIPPGGNGPAAKVAYTQHRHALLWRTMAERPSGAELGRAWGFSKQTWSRAVLGETWMGQTLLVALLEALSRRTRLGPPSGTR